MAGYATLTAEELDAPAVRGLSSTAFRAWVYVVRHARGRSDGWCMSAQSISDQIGSSRTTTFRALREVERAGLITRTHAAGPNGSRGWAKYRLKKPQALAVDDEAEEEEGYRCGECGASWMETEPLPRCPECSSTAVELVGPYPSRFFA